MSAPSHRLSDIRSLIIDIDGVLWKGHDALPGVQSFFDFLRRRNISFVIASNNSARPASEIIERLSHMKVVVTADEVLTSAEATAIYLPRLVGKGARVYVVGGQGITNALEHAGFAIVEQDAEAVVVGIDRHLTYDKLKRATFEIRRGAKFIGTNGDKTFPTEDGIVPGAGAILAAIQAATDMAPIIIGKPELPMFDIAIEQMRADRTRCAMVGDRLDTDIEGAQRAGLKSILVMTGITTSEILAQSKVRPDFVFDNLDLLREAWK